MLIAYEDGRFYAHHGVDGRALLRAAGQWLVRGHIVSGGSTLTMQVARLIEPRPERTLPAKLRQIARAEEIERAVGKAGVLDRYLTLAPFGGNLEGVRAASLAYFGKEPRSSRSPRRRCWSLCRSRPKRDGRIAFPAARARRATACSTAPPPAA